MPTAAELDAADELTGFAGQFEKSPGTVYLDGNSLGLLCRPAEASLREAVDAWRSLAIRGWTDGPEPCGRKLDFLLQEMNREVNTIGSKADGLQVSELVIQAKAELERMREQVQNVE